MGERDTVLVFQKFVAATNDNVTSLSEYEKAADGIDKGSRTGVTGLTAENPAVL